MFEIRLDENELKELYLAEVKKRLDQIELETLLMDSKQLCKMVCMSWPTVQKVFLSDPNFPAIRVGTRWLFNRKEVKNYIDRWSVNTRKRA